MLRRDFLKTATATAVLTATLPVQAKETPAMSNANFADVNGQHIFYSVHGAGKPLILLHGGVNPDSSRRRSRRAIAEAETHRPIRPRNGLGVRFVDNEGQAAVVARNAMAATWSPSGEGSRYNEAGSIPYVPAHLHDVADSKQRGCEGCPGVATARKQPNHSRPLRSGGYARKAASSEQTCGTSTSEGKGSGLTGPKWTMTEIADSLQVLEKNGGDDETRTRDLSRDSPAF
jgi:hypothetical protein